MTIATNLGATIMSTKLIDHLNLKYYNIKEPSSFQNVEKLYKSVKEKFPNVDKKFIKDWLNEQKTFTVHQYAKLNFKRNQINSKYIDHNWHADLVEISHPSKNNGFKYILMVIDNLSKYGWAEPLKNKTGAVVKKAIMAIMKHSKRKPKIFTTDAGKEFTTHSLKKYLKWRKIKHLIARDFAKASVVERWNRTIKEKIHKYLTHKNTKRFINILDDVVDGYNYTIHSRTKFKPIDVNKSNERLAYRNLFKNRTPIENQTFSIGDKVKVFLKRRKFDKGYLANYSKEIFFIHKILYTSPFYKYKVRDKRGSIVRGSYYAKELYKL